MPRNKPPPSDEPPAFPAEPVAGERALLHAPRGGPRTLVVGDLHIGIETDFAIGGVKLPSGTPAMVARLQSLAQKTRARKLVIALWRYLETGVLPEGAVLKT